MPVEITPTENGPYKVTVTEDLKLLDADGVEYDLSDKIGKKIFLCRCGASTNKPFCDSTHSKQGFDAAERAVAREQQQD